MRSRTVLRFVSANLIACLLMGCSSQTNVAQEQFEDSQIGQWSSYDDLVDKILADNSVSRAETEQAINAFAQCLSEHYITGVFTYDLDLYPWIDGGHQGLSDSAPGYTPLTQEQRSDPNWLDTEEAKQHDALWEQIYEKNASYCSMFNRVEQWIMANTDLDVYDRRQYEKKVQCIRNNAPLFADQIDPQWEKNPNALQLLSQKFMPIIVSNETQLDIDGLRGCMTNGGEKTVSF